MFTFAFQGFFKWNCCGLQVFQESQQIRNNKRLLGWRTYLKVLTTGPSERRGYAFRQVLLYGVAGASDYSCEKILASFDDDVNECISGKATT